MFKIGERKGKTRRSRARFWDGVGREPDGKQAGQVRYRLSQRVAMVLGLVGLLVASSAQAAVIFSGSASPASVAARPPQAGGGPNQPNDHGLPSAGPIQHRGSDPASSDFLTNILPSMREFAQNNFPEGSWERLPSASITLSSPADLRTYFVSSDTDFQNSLGFYTTPGGINARDAALIFPNATEHHSHNNSNSSANARPPHAPLLPGDFVDLGSFDAGTQLDFFLIADGARGSGGPVWYTDPTLNEDKVHRAVAFGQAGSPYILVGFEDGADGGAADFRDVMFALHTGETSGGVPAPEPGLIWLMVAGCGGWLHRARRKRREQTGTV